MYIYEITAIKLINGNLKVKVLKSHRQEITI